MFWVASSFGCRVPDVVVVFVYLIEVVNDIVLIQDK